MARYQHIENLVDSDVLGAGLALVAEYATDPRVSWERVSLDALAALEMRVAQAYAEGFYEILGGPEIEARIRAERARRAP